MVIGTGVHPLSLDEKKTLEMLPRPEFGLCVLHKLEVNDKSRVKVRILKIASQHPEATTRSIRSRSKCRGSKRDFCLIASVITERRL